MENSLFLSFFGDTPQFRIMDFMLENRLGDFTKTEIAKGAGISWASLFNHWDKLEKAKIVKLTRVVGRARLYQLNEAAPIVQKLKAIELALIKQAAEANEMKAVVTPKKAHQAVAVV